MNNGMGKQRNGKGTEWENDGMGKLWIVIEACLLSLTFVVQNT